MKKLLAVIAAALAFGVAGVASATTILVFGQVTQNSPITANDNGVSTSINASDVAVTLTTIENGAPNTPAFFTFHATSVGSALTVGGQIIQAFSGTFSFTSGLGGTGFNYLSGSFTDAVFGALNGASLTLSASQPPDAVSFTSDIITDLGTPRAISLGFTDVSPLVSLCGSTICGFTSNVAGNFSANGPLHTPEPGTLALLGIGLVGATVLRRRKS